VAQKYKVRILRYLRLLVNTIAWKFSKKMKNHKPIFAGSTLFAAKHLTKLIIVYPRVTGLIILDVFSNNRLFRHDQ